MAAKKRRKLLKLYVWEDVLTDYTSGIAFALAPDEASARKLVEDAYGIRCTDFKAKPKVFKRPIGFTCSGGG